MDHPPKLRAPKYSIIDGRDHDCCVLSEPLRDDHILPIICPTCQSVFEKTERHRADLTATLHGVVFQILSSAGLGPHSEERLRTLLGIVGRTIKPGSWVWPSFKTAAFAALRMRARMVS